MGDQVGAIKQKVETAKTQVDLLKQMADGLAKDKKHKNVEKLLTEIESSLDLREQKLMEQETIDSAGEQQELLQAKQEIAEVRELLQDIRVELEQLADTVTDHPEVVTARAPSPKPPAPITPTSPEREDTSTQESTTSPGGPDKSEDAATEGQSWFERSWLGRQVSALGDDEEWANYPERNIGRIVGGVGVVRGVKKLVDRFRGDNEAKEQDTENDTGLFGKMWKYAGYAGAGIAGFFGLKWLFDQYATGGGGKGNGPEVTDNSSEQVNKYNEESQETKERYGGFGRQVNNFYKSIYQAELATGWEDTAALGQIGEQVELREGISAEQAEGVVPYAINNTFSSVDKFLSEEAITYMAYSNNIEYYKTKIKGRIGTKIFDKFLLTSLGTLASFTGFITKNGSRDEKIDEWISQNPQERKKELELFFRQYSKVLTYLNDKKDQLEWQLAKQAYQQNPAGFADLEAAIADPAWYNKHVRENSTYQQFLNSSLYGAIDILQIEGLLTAEVSDDAAGLQYMIREFDKERADVLDGTPGDDAINAAEQDIADGELQPAQAESMGATCERLVTDIEANFEESFLFAVFGSAHNFVNSEEYNVNEFLEETGMKQMKQVYQDRFLQLQNKAEQGSLTKQDISTIRTWSNAYFAFKKEALIAGSALQEVRGEDPDVIIRGFMSLKLLFTEDFTTWVGNSYDNFCKGTVLGGLYGYLWGLPAVNLTATLIGLKFPRVERYIKRVYNYFFNIFLRGGKRVGSAALYHGVRYGGKTLGRTLGSPWLLRKYLYNPNNINGLGRLRADLLTGRISPTIGNGVLRTRRGRDQIKWHNGEKYNNIFSMLGEKLNLKDEELRLLLGEGSHSQLNFTHNKAVREGLFDVRRPKFYADVLKYDGSYTVSLQGGYRPWLDRVKAFDNAFAAWGEEQQALARKLYVTDIITTPDQLRRITEVIDELDSATLRGVSIDELVKRIQETPELLDHDRSLRQLINEIGGNIDLFSRQDYLKQIEQQELVGKLTGRLNGKVKRLERQIKLVENTSAEGDELVKLYTGQKKNLEKFIAALKNSDDMPVELLKAYQHLLGKVTPHDLRVLYQNMDESLLTILKQGNKEEFITRLDTKGIRNSLTSSSDELLDTFAGLSRKTDIGFLRRIVIGGAGADLLEQAVHSLRLL